MSKGQFSELHLRTGVSGEFILDEPLTYRWVDGETIRELKVPAEFPTDLASIPRVFRLFFPVNGKHRKAAVVHDYLYSWLGNLPEGTTSVDIVSGESVNLRKFSDGLFLQMMKDLGVSRFKRYPMYWGVRSGGWVAWNN